MESISIRTMVASGFGDFDTHFVYLVTKRENFSLRELSFICLVLK
jgi:hypothetical protein